MALKPLNSVGGFSVGENPSNVILSNGYFQGNGGVFTGNLLISNATASWGILTDNLYYSNGTPWDMQEAAGSNNEIQFNLGDNFAASANFTFDPATNFFTVLGNSQFNNANLGNLATANFVNVSNKITTSNLTVNLELQGNTANFDGNVTMDDWLTVSNTANVGNLRTNNLLYANGTPWDFQEAAGANYEIQYNINNNFAASANFTYNDSTQLFTVLGNSQFNNANLGNLAIANFVNVASNVISNNLTVNLALSGNTASFSGNVIVPNLTVNLELAGNTANFSGNIKSLNAALGNLATANYVNVSQQINGNIANFSGNLTSLNANLGNLATANYLNVAFDANVTGNLNAGNIVGVFANGTSNVRIFNNANVEISVAGSANTVSFTTTGVYVDGEIETTAGNILSNGNITANGFLNGANANITGETKSGSVLTANITAPTGTLTISAAGTNQNIILNPSGTGNVDVGLHNIVQVGGPVNPNDAATKEYVDSIAQGLSVHTAVKVTSLTNLNATYNDGGTSLTTNTISGGKTITFSTNHGLSIGDEIYWTNSFNGIVSNDAYFVYSTPALNQITVKAGFYGAEVTTLTNGTGLTQAARGNPGVGATLTNNGANVALSIDSIALSTTDRVLVQGQTNAWENGVYVVTTVGASNVPGPGAQWVLTRATNEDQYDPKSTTGLGYGDYFFVQQGTNAAGSSYVLNSPVGEIVFGITNIQFVQFSASGSYTAGSGIAINGTIISANVDNTSTEIVGGNIVVKAGGTLSNPNITDATFSSLTWNSAGNGNISGNNLSISNVANITANLTVGGFIQANGTISSNANVSGLNLTTVGNVEAGANVLAANVNANTLITAPTANISTVVNAGNANIQYNLQGNTANFSGNISSLNANLGNLATANYVNVSQQINGNVANFSGNLTSLNASLGNLATANYVNVSQQINGNIANFSGNLTSLNANLGNLATANYVNVSQQINGNTANFTGNIDAANANLGNLVTANYFTGTLANGTSNVAIPTVNGNINLTAGGNTTLVVTATGANVTGTANVTGNIDGGANLNLASSLFANNITSNNVVNVGNTAVRWATVTTTAVTANQAIAVVPSSGITGFEFIVKGVDSSGSKYTVATVTAVTDGTTVDYVTFATAALGGTTGMLAVNVVGSNVELQVTPASSNSTVWTTQYRTI